MENISVVEVGNIPNILSELNCNVPKGLAFLPKNLFTAKTKQDLIYENSEKTFRTLFRNANLELHRVEKEGDKIHHLQHNAFEWIGPTIFIGISFLSENPNGIAVALSVIANYATDFFKGLSGKKIAKLEIIIEEENGLLKNKKNYQKISYEGPVEGIHSIAEVIKHMKK
jgi:hypothetical protein